MLQLKYKGEAIEAGCDEAGRGCLAGPVFAAAVILPDNFYNELLNDSKQLSEKQRDQLRPIIEKEAVAWAVAAINNHEIFFIQTSFLYFRFNRLSQYPMILYHIPIHLSTVFFWAISA